MTSATSHTNVQLWLSSSLSSWYGTSFLSGQRSVTERTTSTACNRTDENMAVWHAAILSKIDSQQPHSQALSSLPSLVAPCGKSLSARLDDQMCLTIYKLARVLGLSWNGKLTASTMYTEACRVSVTCRENDAKILQHTAGYGRYSSMK